MQWQVGYYSIMEMRRREFPGRKNLKDCEKKAIAGSQKRSSILGWGGAVSWHCQSDMAANSLFCLWVSPRPKGLDKAKIILLQEGSDWDCRGSSCSFIGWPRQNLSVLVLRKLKLIYYKDMFMGQNISRTVDMKGVVRIWTTFHLIKVFSVIVRVNTTLSTRAHTGF